MTTPTRVTTHTQFDMITVEEYFAFEETATLRHEFVDGQIYAMYGGKRPHDLIIMRLAQHTRSAADRRPECQVFANGMKLVIEARNTVYYPDIVASCDPADRDERYANRPCLIVEVLSRSTAEGSDW